MPNGRPRAARRLRATRRAARRNGGRIVVAVPRRAPQPAVRNGNSYVTAFRAHLGRDPNAAELLWLKSLQDPFQHRGVRIPSPFPVASQVATYHGNLTFSTNAGGFARVYMHLAGASSVGDIRVYNDVTHNETTLGAATTLLTPTISNYCGRIVNAGMKVRSNASFSTEAGYVQAYFSHLAFSLASYDLYRDVPSQHLYPKGQLAEVRYLPADFSSLSFENPPLAHLGGNTHMGFMIVGAASTSYFLQYSFTMELMSGNNTDTIPHRNTDFGLPDRLMPAITQHNHAKPGFWSWVWETVRDNAGPAVRAVGPYVVSALAGGKSQAPSGYTAIQSGPVGGNRSILDVYGVD